MTSPNGGESAILFQNEYKTVFLIDIPRSIELAQELRPGPSSTKHEDPSHAETSISREKSGLRGRKRYLISAPPRQAPFPSTEPKSRSARERVLETITVKERWLHGGFVQPTVLSALKDIHAALSVGGGWCLPRRVLAVEPGGKRKLQQGGSFQQLTLPDGDTTSPTSLVADGEARSEMVRPPVILSSRSVNAFESYSDLDGIVKNPSSESAILTIGLSEDNNKDDLSEYIVPPRSTFLLCTLPLTDTVHTNPVPGIPPDQKFNLILFDPPWPNRSVRRSSHYETHPYAEMELLTRRLQDILRVHTFDQPCHFPADLSPGIPPDSRDQRPQSEMSLAAIWITNAEKTRRAAYQALTKTGFRICEEWIWVKVAADGQSISPLDGIWRRPYEILVIGRKESHVRAGEASQSRGTDLLEIDPSSIKRRVIAGVPDLHSRKPNLKDVFEGIFFKPTSAERAVDSYSALEVFARNLTAGWWACGNEVLKFNARECWTDDET